MLDLEKILRKLIARRFRDLRGDTPYELISSQRGNISRIERGLNADSGNFVSATLLDEYSNYFGISKAELVFGDDGEIENTLCFMFLQIYVQIIPKVKVSYMKFPFKPEEFQDDISPDIYEKFREIFIIFGDYYRWYKVRKYDDNSDKDIDVVSMFKIVWALLNKKIISSFKLYVITEFFNDSEPKFNFNQINAKFNLWYDKHFVHSIIPEALSKLQADSIFKMGFMVKDLIDNFIEVDLPESYLEDVPLEEFLLPVKSYHFNFKENLSDEEIMKVSAEIVKMTSRDNTINSLEDIKRISEETFFTEFDFITDESTPFVNGTRRVNANSLLDSILMTPDIFDRFHDLNSNERKIPGLLSTNSQASKLFQFKVNEVYLQQIDELVRFQNIYINLIKWDELETFI
ncbi:helix-turn-helix domain-containing protein [Streptococcus salivarius]|uniref:helix-turn-helix domain-containing protein n=1 Tax=Streptococcus salivarius TaxID=1304 RepID=UPI000E46D22F|nr:hypothetical protein [Streptococcus salivarius]RGS20964.1 hypothetical protein DWY09_00750 [Streptococcus salivarius]